MNRDQKAAVIDEIAEQIGSSEAVFAVDYRGITVTQVAELRDKLRDADARFRVVKNSLSERAADQAGASELKPMLVGPTALALVKGDAAMAAKALNDTARQLNLLEFKGGLLNGSVLSADDVRSIARLPSREVLYGTAGRHDRRADQRAGADAERARLRAGDSAAGDRETRVSSPARLRLAAADDGSGSCR